MKNLLILALCAFSFTTFAQKKDIDISDGSRIEILMPKDVKMINDSTFSFPMQFKPGTVQDIAQIDQQIAEIQKEPTKEQRIAMLQTQRIRIIQTVIRDREIVKWEDVVDASPVQGSVINIFVRKPKAPKASKK